MTELKRRNDAVNSALNAELACLSCSVPYKPQVSVRAAECEVAEVHKFVNLNAGPAAHQLEFAKQSFYLEPVEDRVANRIDIPQHREVVS